jgi:YhcH/YjgK/YiaL family protein
MIIDTIANARQYAGLGERIARALSLLAGEDFRGRDPGRHDVDGTVLYYMVQSYTTKPREEGRWESHRKYIDVQFVAEGVERIGWAPAASLEVAQPYDASKDAALHAGEGDFLTVKTGTFAIFWPEEAHMPGIAAGAPAQVRKVVVKILP